MGIGRFSWKRLGKAMAAVLLPFTRGAFKHRKKVALALGWIAALGGAAWVSVSWGDVVPPTVRGRLVLGALFLLVAGMGVSAAYRLLTWIDDLTDEERRGRDEVRRQVVNAIQQLRQEVAWLQKAVVRNSRREAEAAVTVLRESLESYREVSKQLNALEAGRHTLIQTEIRAALEEESGKAMCERMFPAILQAHDYTTRFGGHGGRFLEQDELEDLGAWNAICDQVLERLDDLPALRRLLHRPT